MSNASEAAMTKPTTMPYRDFADHAAMVDNNRSPEDSGRASTLLAMDLARHAAANPTGGRFSLAGLRVVALHDTDGQGPAIAVCDTDGGRWLRLRISEDDARELAAALLRAVGRNGEDGAP